MLSAQAGPDESWWLGVQARGMHLSAGFRTAVFSVHQQGQGTARKVLMMMGRGWATVFSGGEAAVPP